MSEPFTPEQIAIIKSQVAQGATNDELALFLQYCARTGLDPFSRQIYLSERSARDPKTGGWITKRQPETSIDGFRLIAERTDKYAGQTAFFWCGDDGVWTDVWLKEDPPKAAKVGILRHDFKEPLWSVALYSEYVQVTKDGLPNAIWKRRGAAQLAKCAESLGLRRAFPRELSGLYSHEEMGQSQSDYERGSREEQRAVAERKIAQLSAIEDGHGVIAKSPEPEIIEKSKKTSPPVSFRMLEAFSQVKKQMNDVTGNDEDYYSILNSFGVDKSNQIATRKDGEKIYKALGSTLSRLRHDDALKATLGKSLAVLGDTRYWEILGRDYACASTDDVLALDTERLTSLLSRLKAEVDEIVKPA